MEVTVFDFDNYKDYLNQRLDNPVQGGGRGARSKLSEAIRCQTAYTAQVLRGSAHFSPDQIEAINDFLGHSEEEGHFLLLINHYQRAGNPRLRARYRKQIQGIRENRLNLKNRLGIQTSMSELDQVTYYSSWYYAAIHALISIPQLQSIEALARHLQLENSIVADALEFLVRSGLVVKGSGKNAYSIGKARLHLGADSPLIVRHHSNWRLQAIRSLERKKPESLHYSSAVSISEKDQTKIRELFVRAIESSKEIIRSSPEERACCLSLDFFEI